MSNEILIVTGVILLLLFAVAYSRAKRQRRLDAQAEFNSWMALDNALRDDYARLEQEWQRRWGDK
jgi:hypothetical protein